METFKATSKYSTINIFRNLEEWENFVKLIGNVNSIIQIAITPNNNVIIEMVHDSLIEKYRNETKLIDKNDEKVKNKEDQALENALDTVLNKDPFGDVYSGWKLKDIADNDPEWIEKAVKELKNTFIKDKLIIIQKLYK